MNSEAQINSSFMKRIIRGVKILVRKLNMETNRVKATKSQGYKYLSVGLIVNKEYLKDAVRRRRPEMWTDNIWNCLPNVASCAFFMFHKLNLSINVIEEKATRETFDSIFLILKNFPILSDI